MTNEEIKKRQEAKEKGYAAFKQYFNYGIVAITSMLVLIVAPALESAITGQLTFPQTLQGWIFWGVGRLAITIINLVIFTALDAQSEINAANNENYKKAKSILAKDKTQQKVARSPKEIKRQTFIKKVPWIIIGSAASLVALSQIILDYKLATLISYLFTVIMDIIWAIWHMIDKEINYWSDEYLRYALNYEQEETNLEPEIGPKEEE